MMEIQRYNRPFVFYGVAVLVPWTFWFIMAGISQSPLWNDPNWMLFGSILGLIGLIAPAAVAMALILPNKEMWDELKSACVSFKGIHPGWWILTFLLPPASILLAQAVSLLFGRSVSQFQLIEHFSFSAGIFPAWFLLFLAPVLEEFGWHTYGIHCIRQKRSLFATCMIFGLIWGVWHMPLSFVKDYYQNVVAETGIIYSVNFLVSIIPYLIIDNWMYYKTKRNMFLEVAFHLLMGFSNEVFQTHPDSKVIQTVLLLIVSGVILIKEKDFFFEKNFVQKNYQ
jgi:membrane protease YdiL (CAAX protease family)